MAAFKDKSQKPQVAAPNFNGVPLDLRALPQWVLWRFDWVEETKQWAKVPYASNGQRAKSNSEDTWSTFDEVRLAFGSDYAGIGFVFTGDDEFVGIDFDNCVEGDNTTAEVVKWISHLASYTEMSVSGTGVHVIVRGKCQKAVKRNGIEVYGRLRYFAFSGLRWSEDSELKVIANRQRELDELLTALTPSEPIPSKTTTQQPTKSTRDLLDIAFNARNGASIRSLYGGDVSAYGNDDSSADLALASKLAFYSGGDPSVLDEMFRGSQLYRRKWDTRHSGDGRTYGQMTIDRALSGCTEFYSPTKRVQTQNEPPTAGIYRVRDIRDKVFELYRTGRQPGEHPGWDSLAKLYTVKRGQFTVLTGVPGAGKSAFLDAMLVNLALSKEWKFAVCSVENQPIEQHVSVLTEIHLGLPFSKGPHPRMTQEDLRTSLDWIEKHFTFVLPPEDRRTLEGVISCVAELEVDGVAVDPWNELEHRRPAAMSETEYVSEALSRMRHHARLFNQHWWLVAHPTKLQKDKVTGKYNVPTLYDISGSANFRNKADFGIVAWRDAEIPASPTVVYVQKVRFRWCGEIGSCELYFDKVTGRYSDRPNVYGLPSRERYA